MVSTVLARPSMVMQGIPGDPRISGGLKRNLLKPYICHWRNLQFMCIVYVKKILNKSVSLCVILHDNKFIIAAEM